MGFKQTLNFKHYKCNSHVQTNLNISNTTLEFTPLGIYVFKPTISVVVFF